MEVFDEFVLAGNSVILTCQAPSHLDGRYLDHVAWLKDDKIIVTRQQQFEQVDMELARFGASGTNSKARFRQSGSFETDGERQKYLMLQTGELLIRWASKTDSATYKCRARNRLTGSMIVSKIGGQLMVDDSSTKSQLRQTGQQPLIWVRENTENVFICAQFQSLPVATYSWFWHPANAATQTASLASERRSINGNEMADIRLQLH